MRASEIDVHTKKIEQDENQRARSSLWGKRLPTESELAQARGLVIRERENSIFSDAWLPVSLIFIAIGLAANRNAPMLALGVTLLIVAGVGNWWKRIALVGVTYERAFDRTHVFPGERINMTLTMSNRKLFPLTWLQFRDQVPIAPVEEEQLAVVASEMSGTYVLESTLSMSAYDQTQRRVPLEFPQRGFYEIGPVNFQSGDIFTLFTVERQYRNLDTVVVYPQVWPLNALQLPAKEIFGELPVRRSLFADPVRTQGIRDYQPQDRFRDIHWKVTARRSKLQTKVYDPSSGMTVAVFLNVATFPKHWMGFDPDLLERAICVSASLCSYAEEQKWGVGVYANGSVPGSDQPICVPPGRAPGQIIRILEALAAVTEFATASIEMLMHRESRRIPWAATLVLVTALVTEEMLVTLTQLKEAGRRIALVALSDEIPQVYKHSIPVFHAPANAPAFEREQAPASITESSLSAVPIPKPMQITKGRATK